MRICLITYLFLVSSKLDAQPMDFESYVKQIFFGANIEKVDTTLVEQYKSNNDLKLKPQKKSYTLYPPLSSLGDDGNTQSYNFIFQNHPHISFAFNGGELILQARKSNGDYIFNPPILRIFFATKAQSELAYKELESIFNKLSTRKRFSAYDGAKNAEFTDDRAKTLKAVTFLQGKDDVQKGYVIIFVLGNDMGLN